MGGAGTGVPPVELLLVVPPLLLELELEEVDVELMVDEDVEELELPKLEVPPALLADVLDEDELLEDEAVPPLQVLDELPPVHVEQPIVVDVTWSAYRCVGIDCDRRC